MRMLDRMERKLGWLVFPGLLKYYAIFHALVYGLQLVRPNIGEMLDFDRAKILHGEVWRVITFLFAGAGMGGFGMFGLLFLFFMVMIAHMMSDALEGEWGVWRMTMFHYSNIIGLVVANFLLPGVMPGSGFLFYGASFLAFATLFPRVEFLLMLVIPVQVRFLAWIQVAFMVISAGLHWPVWVIMIMGNLGYILFAGLPVLRGRAREADLARRRTAFRKAKQPEDEAFHRCVVCGRNDVEDPEMEFRVGEDGREYCEHHLGEEK